MPLPTDYVSTRALRSNGGFRINPAALVYQLIENAITIDTDGISVAHAGAAVASTRNMTIGGALASGGQVILDVARNVVITVTHGSAVVAMSGTISGYDKFGNLMTEAWSVTAGTVSKTFTGAKAFKIVTGITEVIVADASANTIIAGQGKVFGLDAMCSVASLVKETSGGSVVTNGTLVAASTVSTADLNGTYTPNAAPDGTTDFELWYISNNPERGR